MLDYLTGVDRKRWVVYLRLYYDIQGCCDRLRACNCRTERPSQMEERVRFYHNCRGLRKKYPTLDLRLYCGKRCADHLD